MVFLAYHGDGSVLIPKLSDSWRRILAAMIVISIGLGVIKDLRLFFLNETLHVDELSLANNLLEHSPWELLHPLDYDQMAPVGFLMLQKGIIYSFGSEELALRALPLVSHIVSLGLFFALANWVGGLETAALGTTLFSLLKPPTYYAVFAKQYSSDVLATLAVLLLCVRVLDRSARLSDWLILAAFGSVIIWFSHPSIFVLAGVAMGLVMKAMKDNQRTTGPLPLIIAGIWVISFSCQYFFVLHNDVNLSFMTNFWKDSFMPVPPKSTDDILWFMRSFTGIFSGDESMQLHWAGGVAALGTIMGMLLVWGRSRVLVIIFIAPLCIAMVASGLHRYPFYGRFLNFFIPVTVILIGLWLHHLISTDSTRVLATVIFVFLCLQPALTSAKLIIRPEARFADSRAVVEYLSKHAVSGAHLYVYGRVRAALKYYGSRFKTPYIELRRLPPAEDVGQLQGIGDTWVLIAGIGREDQQDFSKQVDEYESAFNRVGDQRRRFFGKDISLFKYQF